MGTSGNGLVGDGHTQAGQTHTGHAHTGHAHAGHTHGVGLARAGERHRRRLTIALGIALILLAIQLVVGLTARSLAVLSDAGHVATDAVGLGIALGAILTASRARQSPARTFGLYRLEVLAALVNAMLLLGVAGWVSFEAVDRLRDGVEVPGTPVFVVGIIGLIGNLIALWLLSEGAGESMNLRGARLEVLADAVGSIGVLVGGAVILLTGWLWVDPLIGLGVGLFIIPRAIGLGRDALRVLVQAAPPHHDIDGLRTELSDLPGVVDVHDLHLWTLTSEMEVLTAHLMVTSGTDTHETLDRARRLLSERHGLHHATLQVEPEDHTGCDDIGW